MLYTWPVPNFSKEVHFPTLESLILMKYSQLTRPFLCLSGWNMVSAKSSPCVSQSSRTGIYDSEEKQSSDSLSSLPVLRLNHGNCKVFSAAASQPTPTGISARSTSELQSQLFGHEKISSPILSMANHSATRWGPRSVLASPWLGTNL